MLSYAVQVATGGDASTLDGLVYLCSRNDRDPLLFFTGQLAQLQVSHFLIRTSQWFYSIDFRSYQDLDLGLDLETLA